jgi:hypothetical protein
MVQIIIPLIDIVDDVDTSYWPCTHQWNHTVHWLLQRIEEWSAWDDCLSFRWIITLGFWGFLIFNWHFNGIFLGLKKPVRWGLRSAWEVELLEPVSWTHYHHHLIQLLLLHINDIRLVSRWNSNHNRSLFLSYNWLLSLLLYYCIKLFYWLLLLIVILCVLFILLL